MASTTNITNVAEARSFEMQDLTGLEESQRCSMHDKSAVGDNGGDPLSRVVTAEQTALQALEIQAPAAARVLHRWNSPRSNMWRTFAAFYSFLILGAAAAAYGVSLNYPSCDIYRT